MFEEEMLTLLNRWNELNGEERMMAISELVASGELDEASLAMLHEMFLVEAAQMDDATVEAMVAAAYDDLVAAEVDAELAAQADLPKYKQKSRRAITRLVRERLDSMMADDRAGFDALLTKHVATQERAITAQISALKKPTQKPADETVDAVADTAAKKPRRAKKIPAVDDEAQSDALIKSAAKLSDELNEEPVSTTKPKPKRKRKMREVDGRLAQEVILEFVEAKDGVLNLQKWVMMRR